MFFSYVSNSAITCYECKHKDTGDRIACEDPDSAEVETICSGAVSPTPEIQTDYRDFESFKG